MSPATPDRISAAPTAETPTPFRSVATGMREPTVLGSATVEFVDTPDGPFGVLVDAEGCVIASGWTDDVAALVDRLRPGLRPSGVTEGRIARTGSPAVDAVRDFYRGEFGGCLRVPVRQWGTDLQRAGWGSLRRIPAGSTLSYRELAIDFGRPTAVRAAAAVCARNAVALFVPCHRVRRSDGSLGGFAWGLDVKRSLLEREGAAAGAAARAQAV